MTKTELEATDIADLDVVTNPADLRRDIHVFVDYARTHEIKRGHRDNQLPLAHRQRLARLMSDARIAQVGEDGSAPWIAHVDAVCFRLGFVRYNTEGIYAGYSSSSESFPDNYIQWDGTQYERFLDLPLLKQEQRILDVHLKETGAGVSEFFSEGPLSRLDRFDTRGCATGVVPTIPFAKVRMDLLKLLAECPSGVWFSTQSFIEHLRLRDPWFLIPKHVPAAVAERAIRSGRYSNFIERKRGDWGNQDTISDRDPEGFAKVEGRFVGLREFTVPVADRGRLKHALIKLGYPTEDLAGYAAGEPLLFDIALRTETRDGLPFAPRRYQREAADLFYAGGEARGGSGVVALPCGAGKTIVGAVCMSLLRASTLILVTNVTAARQWKHELMDKTTVPADAIGLYHGDAKEIRPVAIQVSGMFGSRQEEAQRLGRILRPKTGENQAHFYSIISRDTVEQEFALNRQHFLCEQGYQYRIVTLDEPNAALPVTALSRQPRRDEQILCAAG
jgi:hypothetical protein